MNVLTKVKEMAPEATQFAWEESCELRFINFWNLDKDVIIPQGE